MKEIVRLSLVGAAALLLIGCAPAKQLTTRELAMSCTTDMATQFHIHPNLKIVIGGKNVPIPEGIGIVDGCMHPLHTHDATGQLHVESPEKRDFTLGDFFAVWGKPFDKDHILDAAADTRNAVRMSVNGKDVDTFEGTVVHDKDDIVIRYESR